MSGQTASVSTNSAYSVLKAYRVMRNTKKSSDYFGSCEICGEYMAECYVSEPVREVLRPNGTIFKAKGAAKYGHKDCLNSTFGEH